MHPLLYSYAVILSKFLKPMNKVKRILLIWEETSYSLNLKLTSTKVYHYSAEKNSRTACRFYALQFLYVERFQCTAFPLC